MLKTDSRYISYLLRVIALTTIYITSQPISPPNMVVFECRLLHGAAKPPVRQTQGAAGYDLCGVSANTNDNGVGVINTGVAIQIPHGYYGKIEARSSYAFRHGMQILAGVIDEDYRGELKILYKANNSFEFQAGERCAQLIIIPFMREPVTIVEEFSNNATDRTGGFGSTG